MSISSAVQTTTPHPAGLNPPARDVYHGVGVMDEHRWLENGNDSAVKAWTCTQNRRTREHLDAIKEREVVLAQLAELFAQVTPSYSEPVARPCGLFAFKFHPPKQQHLWVTLASANDPASEKIVLDPNELEPKAMWPSIGSSHPLTGNWWQSACRNTVARKARCISITLKPD